MTVARHHGTRRLRHPPATVGALILDRRGRVFLAQSERWGGRLSVPGGHIEFGERAEDAVAREVREETGLQVTPQELLLVQQAIFPKEFAKREHFIFLDYLCLLRGHARVKLDRRELQGYIWATPTEALKLNLESYTRTLLEYYKRTTRRRSRIPK